MVTAVSVIVRAMSKRPLFALAALCLIAGMAATTRSSQAQSADAILRQVNQFRLNNGLPPFTFNSALAAAAQNQANYMAEYNVFSSHVGYGGSTPLSRAQAAGYNGRVTENIVGGTNLTAPRALTWWVNSPVHYNALITTRYTEAGTGFSAAGEINYYVLVVGQPASAPIQPPADSTDPEPLFITPITLAEPGEDGSIVHEVQEGQALWSLAAHYDVPLSDLLLYNGLKPDSFVQPGDEIIIRLPEGAPIPPTPTPPTTHIVREGESLWTIAASYDVKIGDVMWFNNLTENSFLQPGQEIKVRLAPGELPPPTPTPIREHIVQAGQTLWEIALTYGLTLEQLLAFNDLDDSAIIKPGDALLIRPPDPPTPTPLPTSTATPVPATPGPTPTPTSMAFPLASPAAVANVDFAAGDGERDGLTAVATPIPSRAQGSSQARPWLIGVSVFALGLVALAGAFVVALRREKL